MENKPIITFTLSGDPKTKKNSQSIKIIRGPNGKMIPLVSQSVQYQTFETHCLYQLNKISANLKKQGVKLPIKDPINLKCIYYRENKQNIDITNLMAATHDILTEAGVIEDDNWKIVDSVDGSRVRFDNNNPRTDIEITFVDNSTYSYEKKKEEELLIKKENERKNKELERIYNIYLSKKYRDEGLTWKKVAEKINLSTSTASKYYKEFETLPKDKIEESIEHMRKK